MKYLQIWDFVLAPIYIFIIYQIAKSRADKKIALEPHYKYFASGILAKMLGGVALCLIYTLYYIGGDTTAYFEASVCMTKLFFRHNPIFWKLTFGAIPYFLYQYFDASTGFPDYWRDVQSWQVVRWTTFFAFIGLRCYILTTIVLSAAAYIGIWRLYKVFIYYYPMLSKQLAFAILFIPSVLFWGSGVLKDTYTLSCAGLLTYCFHQVFIVKNNRIRNIIIGFICSSILINIKPYIFLGLVPGALLWISFERIKGIQSPIVKLLIAPLILTFTIALASLGFNSIKESFGQYSSLDKIVTKASVTQKDLKQDYNKGNSFDIGEFDGSVSGILAKFPVAVFAGLFRPSFLDVKNVVMLIAAIENAYMLYLLVSAIYGAGLFNFYKIIISEPIIFFSIIFSLFFAFSVGLTTSNFGALVRYKIPSVPFYIAAMIIIKNNKIYKPVVETSPKNKVKKKIT
jgi:hypothetical protein